MAVTIKELVTSRKMKEVKREGRLEKQLNTEWMISGSDDPASAAVLAIGPQIDAVWSDGSLGLICIDRDWEVMRATGSTGLIKLVATYGPPEQAPNQTPEDPEYELSLMAESVHIEKALSQQNFPSSASHVGNLIGVNGGKIDGVDAYFPKATYTETRERNVLDARYRRKIMELSSTINASAWKGWEPGEVLFLGATARRKGRGVWRLQFAFSMQPNAVISVDTLSGPQTVTKPGWDYLWYERKQNSFDTLVLQTGISAAHLAAIYPRSDFGLLGLGT